jgi:hypothetical protein
VLAHLGRTGEGRGGGGECGGPDGGRAGTQEPPAVENEHVSSPSLTSGHSTDKASALITEVIFLNMIDRLIGSIDHDGIRVAAFVCCRG